MNVTHDRAIITAVQKLTGTFNQDTVYLVTANVTSVDENKGICTVETISGNASITLTNVELQTVVSDGILIVPRVDSEVKVIYSKYTTPFICQYSEVEKIYLACDTQQMDIGDLKVNSSTTEVNVDSTLDINCNEITFNGGSNKGLVKVVELTQQLNKIEADLNSLKTIFLALNATIAALPPPTPILASILAGLFAPFNTYGGHIITPTVETQIEDTKITH